MAAPLALHVGPHELVLQNRDQTLLRVALGRGGLYRLLAGDEPQLHDALAVLETAEPVNVLAADGGLLGRLTVAQQLALALDYGASADEPLRQDRRERLQQALQRCGIDPAQALALGPVPAERLPRLQRWRLGLALRLLRPPELLVLERPFAGLSRRQAQAVSDLLRGYLQFHPFRPVLLLELDAHDGPPLPPLCAQAELQGYEPRPEREPCLC